MKMIKRNSSRSIWFALVLFGAALLPLHARGQAEPKAKRLQAPATVRGLIGSESHDAYVVRVRKGRTLEVQISWRKEEDNFASFGIGDSADFNPVQFGKEYHNGRKWVGKVPKTGDYFIEVVAHPAAHY